ncbi:glycosyltransferase family 4 protein [Cylindrospermum sp. FACHB-282]|uniref:glycosyltransferase family 4 protein n=1 Tax=Cylindrospermum sp. FACHB-282 TaxID=2692794 RepID=UPI001681F1D3|nr:glycosyltransferase family 4 protein [Cylindrospermum sp. FACHB-282]MBD2385322.1 glycosyltransferase family 4 protein [Cylindrospermum sp. FACHB-282]
MSLKIAIVVHGRFHGFDLARELINQGHDVTLLTNYPKNIVEKFGIPEKFVQTFLLHGLSTRVLHKLHEVLGTPDFEAFIHCEFSKWAARNLIKYHYDSVHVFSGVAEEIFQALSDKCVVKSLVRGSAHIRTQFQLLLDEEKRAGVSVDKPSNWMIAREEREYQLADVVVVLSTFAQQSFIHQDITPEKLKVLPLGTQLERFRPVQQVIAERCHRIVSKLPLRVLMVGTCSYRKGALDFVKIAELGARYFQFKFVGTVTSEASDLAQSNSGNIEFIPKQPQFELPKFYSWADIFIFTTIEDGYAVVLSQAQATGLPILTTTNCSGSDIVVEGKTGWVLPIRSPESFVERLHWCDEHRQELAQMVWRIYQDFQPRDWTEVAAEFVSIHTDLLKKKLG